VLHDQCFPKAARLRRRAEFLRVQGAGQRQNLRHFVLVAAPGKDQAARLGITVSARVGNAVARNRVKRLVRELYRTRSPHRECANDVVVIAKPGAEVLTYAEVVSELDAPLAAALRG
jgi:ribonuclease P protein component